MSETSRERPILFSGPMVRAILDGRKTQTRRIVRRATGAFWDHRGYTLRPCDDGTWMFFSNDTGEDAYGSPIERCPYGVPGDRLWVRETIHRFDHQETEPTCVYSSDSQAVPYRSGVPEGYCGRAVWQWPKLRVLARIPRWASRLTLEVTEVRVQRLGSISDEDAKAEGVSQLPLQEGRAGAWWTADVSAGLALHARTPERALAKAWDSINGKRAPWASNPWVWAITFRTIPPAGKVAP